MLGGCAFTFIIINVQKEKLVMKLKDGEFRLFEGLLNKEDINNIDISIEKTGDQVEIKNIVDPIEKYFTDNHSRNCISLQIGFKYEWFLSKKLEFPGPSLALIFRKLKEHVESSQESARYLFKCPVDVIAGCCYNHSYFIQDIELKDVLYKPKDNYVWFALPEMMELKNNDIFRIFPKEYITLPSKEYIFNESGSELWEI